MSGTSTPDKLEDQILGVLLGRANEAERHALSEKLAGSPEARERFLEHVTLQAMLIEEAKSGSLTDDPASYFESLHAESPVTPIGQRHWFPAAIAAVLLGIFTLTALLWPSRATASLDQVLQSFDQPKDRTYRLEVLEEGEPPSRSPDRGRFPPSASLDGARLSLRGSRQFVLEQTLPNSDTRTLGCDGTLNWSIRGKGSVRTSPDQSRFAGGLAGGRQDLAFLDLRSQLEELRSRYELEWLGTPSRFDENGTLKGLHGVRRSDEQGGAKEIELWFEPGSGLIHRLVLNGLPRRNGSPARLAFILESDSALPHDHFQHETHHEPGRQVIEEPTPP